MRKALRKLEHLARRLDPEPSAASSLSHEVSAYVLEYLRDMPERHAFDGEAPQGDGSQFAVDDQPTTVDAALSLIHETVALPGIRPASPGHFGYIPGGGLFPSALGDFIADVLNSYSGLYFASPGATLMERELVRWMGELVGYPTSAGGDLTSGGSIANLSALVTAREAHGIKARDVGKSVVYLTEHSHHCLDKALHVAGLAECPVRRVPTDERWRMRADSLEERIAADRRSGLDPWLVVGTAGTTDTGSIDPLGSIAEIAEAEGLWFHCDAAYGGFFLLTDEGGKKLAGIEHSRSAVMDPHKGLFLPSGTGALVVRDERQLATAHNASAHYMQDARNAAPVLSPSELGPELTRPFRGLRMWLPLKLYGLDSFRACLEEKLLLARYFHSELSKVPGFVVGPVPELSVVTYRYVPESGDADEFNRRLLRAVHSDGRVFISSTLLGDRFTLRFAALHFRSHLDEVDSLLELLTRESRRLARTAPA